MSRIFLQGWAIVLFWLFAAGAIPALQGAGETPPFPLTLRVETGPENHVFFPDEEKSLDVRVGRVGTGEGEVELKLLITLDDGTQSRQTRKVALPAEGEAKVRFELDLPGPCFAECRVSAADRAADVLSTVAVVRPPQLDDVPFHDAFYGVHIMEHPATAKRVGIRFSRELLYWKWTERKKGQRNFSDQAEKARDFLGARIGFIWTFEPNLPDWIDAEHMVRLNQPEFLPLFTQWVEAGLKALPHERMAIEFNNEPDISMGRSNLVSADEAARAAADLLRTGYRVTKKINPEIPVLGGGGSGEAGRTGAFAQKLLEYADGEIDYYSVHPYTHNRYILPDGSVEWPDQFMRLMLEQNAKLAVKYTKGKSLWSTEVGWAYPMDEVYLSPASKDFAAITAQGLVLFKTVENVGKVTWFRGHQHTIGVNERGYDYSLGVLSGKGMRPTTGISAFATVSSLLEGSDTGRQLNLGPALHGYHFVNNKTGQIVTALWTTRYDVSTKTPLPDGVDVIDHYGRTHPADSWKLTRGPTFLVAPLARRSVLDDYLANAQWVPEQAFVILNMGFHETDQWSLAVESLLMNPVDAQVRIGDHSHKVSIKPGENQLHFPADPSSLTVSPINLEVEISGGETTTKATFSKPLLAIPYLAEADKMLANKKPGEALAVHSLDERAHLWPPDPAIPWDGPGDLSVRYGYGWNEHGLYAVYRVRDDRHVGAKDHAFWNYDSLQIALDPATKGGKSGYQPGQRELGLWLDDKGSPHIAQSYPPRNDPPEIPSRITPVEGGAVYEIFLPWRYLFGQEGAPVAGSVLAANFLVNDNDGSGRGSWMSLGDGIGSGKSPSVYPWLRLQQRTD